MQKSKFLNVIVINKAGKVGKSTLSKHLITPMLEGDWIQVETFNDTGEGAKQKIAGRKFEFIAREVVRARSNLCIDVGNSNYEATMNELQALGNFAKRIHLWVIPCKQSTGSMNDSLSTVEDLINHLGVQPERIVVLPNDIESSESGLEGFRSIALAAKDIGFHFCEIAIPQDPKFDHFNADKRSIIDIADDETDYDAALDDVESDEQAVLLVERELLRERARMLKGRFAQVWSASLLPVLTAV